MDPLILHLGKQLTDTTISQHYYWPNLRDNMRTRITVYNIFHKNKKQNLKYGKLPAKEAEAIPWEKLLVDLIGPYIIRREVHDETPILKYLTMIDPATGWFEIGR